MAFSALEDQLDDADTPAVSENVASDIIEYLRGNVIANEQQGLLGIFQLTTGWMRQRSRYVNLVYQGPPAGGKTLVQEAVTELPPDEALYQTTDASNNALIDDPLWDYSLVAPLDEYDKIDKPIREYMKSMAGEDGGYTKKRNVEDDSAKGGYSPETVSSRAMPFQFLYAPVGGKHGIDHELQSRMLTLHIDDNRAIREAIGRKEAGHSKIDVTGLPNTYIFETSNIEEALKRHFRKLDVKELSDETPDEQDIPVRVGGTYAKMPRWVWYSLRPVFDEGPTQTNRVFGMVFNLIRASAVLNHHERDLVTKTVDGETVRGYLVEPQDVANVMSCQPALLATTHNLDPQKRDVLDGVQATTRSEDGMTTKHRIKDWMEDNDKNPPNSSKLGDVLEELEEQYFVKIRERAAEDGTSHLYEFRDEGNVETPRVADLQQYADGDDVDLSDCRIDVSDPYADCWDPIRDQPFKRTVEEFEERFSSSETAINAATMMSGSTDDEDDGQTTLGEDDSSTESSLPDPDGDPSGPIERAVYDAIETMVQDEGTDGWKPFAETDGIGHYVGALDANEDIDSGDVSGTLLDPDHDVYDDEAIAEGRIETVEDCKRELNDALSDLKFDNLVVVRDADMGGFIEMTVQ
jgi:hypothetical protein